MSHPLSAYLPRLLLRRLASGTPFAGPEASHVDAALLLSDIQGFSALVERAAGAGRAALEELTWALNGYFGDVAEAVHAQGGDVLYIAGDAFYCCWLGGEGRSLADAVACAVAAGLEIQQRTAGSRFATRIGVGTGELVVAFAGGLGGRWELIATGNALDDVVAAEQDSATGKVTLSHAAWSLLFGRATARLLADGRRELITLEPVAATAPSPVVLPPDPDRSLRPFAPPAVLDRTLGSEWLAEIRHVSVLLADLPPLGAAGTDELLRMHACVRAFQEVMQRYEGTAKLDVDEKGVLLLGAFGLPPLAHEDDAERAVLAARVLRDALDRIGLATGIGVATGRAFCGAFGNDARRDYMLRGDVINLAARLMHASAGAISCDGETVRAVRGRLAFEPAGSIIAKGRREPVAIYRPASAGSPAPLREIETVGRTEQRERLAVRVREFLAGEPDRAIFIEGEAGMGKSTLLAELRRTASTAGIRVLGAAADAIERTTAYYAWRPVFTELLGWNAGEADAGRRTLETRLAASPELQRLAPLLAAVLSGDFADTELTAEMTGDVRAANTRHLLAALLRDACAERPTMLTVEDAHWLDSASSALLTEVLRSVHPLLAIVTTRPGGELPRDAEVLRLDGLAEEELLALARLRLQVGEIPPALATVIRDRVGGNPFFCDELLRSMRDAGALQVVDGRCVVGDLGKLDLPTTIEGVILSRLDRLTPHQQLCLKVAAVIGRVFRARAVAETYPAEGERPRVPEHLESLVRLELTAPDSPEPDLGYLFRHVITRDVTYALMPLAQRRPLHRAVAEWIEHRFASDLRPQAALLAYHWAQAADAARAADYLEQAGHEALRNGAFQEAVVFFGQAIELAEGGAVSVTPERRARWDKGVGTGHYFAGDLARSRHYLERAVASLDRPVPSGGAAARGLLAAATTQALHRIRPQRYLGRQAARRAVLEEAADCYKILGQIYYLDGEPPPRLAYLTVRGVNVGEEAGPSADLARMLVNMSVVTALLGFRQWADWYAQRAIEMAQQEGQFVAGAYVWHIHALGEAQAARWASAKAANQEALRRIRELGDFNLEAEAYVVRATVLLCEGDVAAAPDAWSRSRQLAERAGNAQILCWSLLDEVETLLGADQVEQADAVLERALAIPTAPSDGSSTLDKHRALAVTRMRQGRIDEALAAADVVLETIGRQPPTGYHWADYYASAAEVAVAALAASRSNAAAPAREQLERRAARASRTLRRLSRNFWNVRPRALLLEGVLAAAGGRVSKARVALDAADVLAVRMDMPFERARVVLARAQLGWPPAAPAERSEALAIFDRLGARYYRRQLEGVS